MRVNIKGMNNNSRYFPKIFSESPQLAEDHVMPIPISSHRSREICAIEFLVMVLISDSLTSGDNASSVSHPIIKNPVVMPMIGVGRDIANALRTISHRQISMRFLDKAEVMI
jgi:hypothetical protein